VVQVSEAYWGLVASTERLGLAQRSLQIASDELEQTRERVQEGFAGSGDVLQVERAVGGARQALVVSEARVKGAESRLARLLGRDLRGRQALTAGDRPVFPDVSADLETSLQRARGANVDWLLAKVALVEAADQRRLSRNDALPDLGLTGSMGWSGLGSDAEEARDEVLGASNRSWAVGADLSVALLARQARGTRAQARLRFAQAELALAAAEQDLLLTVEEAVRSVERDRSRVELAELTVAAAGAALDADRELLREGRGSTRDVVRSLEAMDGSQASLLQARIDLQASILRLSRVEGLLLTVADIRPAGLDPAPSSAPAAPPPAPATSPVAP